MKYLSHADCGSFLSLEKPYDISITIWFCAWENHHLEAKAMTILRRTGTMAIQSNSKLVLTTVENCLSHYY